MDDDDDEIEIIGALNPIGNVVFSHRVFELHQLPFNIKQKCIQIIRELGGTSVFHEHYKSEVTHVVVPEAGVKVPHSLKILGCLASGKHVVTSEYLMKSDAANKFLKEDLFIPSNLVELAASVRLNGKVFSNKHVVILVRNMLKQEELTSILRDGGALVRPWTPKDLFTRSETEMANLEYIFTEPALMDEALFSSFMKLRRTKPLFKKIKVVSYFCVYKYIMTLPGSEERKNIFELFDLENLEVIKVLHSGTKKRQAFAQGDGNLRKRNRVSASSTDIPTVVTLDEEEGDERVEVNLPSTSRDEKEKAEEDSRFESDDDNEVEILRVAQRPTVSRMTRKPRTYEGVLKNLKSNLSVGRVEGNVISIDCDKDDDVARSFATADTPQPSLALVPMSRLQRRVTPSPPLQTSFASASISPRSTTPLKHHDSATPKVTQSRKVDSSSKVIIEVSLDDSDADDEDMIVDDQPASRTAVSTSVRSDNIQHRHKPTVPLAESRSNAGRNNSHVEKSKNSPHQLSQSQSLNVPNMHQTDGILPFQSTSQISVVGARLFGPRFQRPTVDEVRPKPSVRVDVEQEATSNLTQVSASTSSRNETVQPRPSTSKSVERSPEIEPKKPLQVGNPDVPPECAVPAIGSHSDNIFDEIMQATKQIADGKEQVKVPRTWGLSSTAKSNSAESGKGPVKKISPFGKDRNLRQHVELFFPDKVISSADASVTLSSSTKRNSCEEENSSTLKDLTESSRLEVAVPLSEMLHIMNAGEASKDEDATRKDSSSSKRSKSTETKEKSSTGSKRSDGGRSKSSESREKLSTKEKSSKGKDIRKKEEGRRLNSTETKESKKSKASSDKKPFVKLDEKLVNVYLTAFLDRQKKNDDCLDIDNGRTRTPKFDKHKEAPEVMRVPREAVEMEQSHHWEVYFDGSSKYTTIEEEQSALQFLEDITMCLNSTFYPSPITMHKLINKLILVHNFDQSTDAFVAERKATLASKLRFYFFRLIQLHWPKTLKMRLFYLKIFQKNWCDIKTKKDVGSSFWNFLKDLLDELRSETPRKERLVLLDVIIHLLRVDLEFWWKHLRKKTKEKPLIEYLFESKESIETVLRHVLQGLLWAHQCSVDDGASIYRKLVSMIALFCSEIDRKRGHTTLTLNSTGSFKALCSYLVLDKFVVKIGNSPRQIMTQLFLLRPDWLAATVAGLFVSRIVYFGNNLPNLSLESYLQTRVFNNKFQYVDEVNENVEGDSELHLACRLGQSDEVAEILSEAVSVGGGGSSTIFSTNSSNRTPIHEAAGFNRVDCLKLMRDSDEKKFAEALILTDEQGLTPTALAVRNDSVESVNFLLSSLSISSDLTPAIAMGYGDEIDDFGIFSSSERMTRILADHVSVLSKPWEESSLVVVREPKLFETLTSIYLDKMLSVVPSFAVCASSLAHQDPSITRIRYKGLSKFKKIFKLKKPHSGHELKFDNGVYISKDVFSKDVSMAYHLITNSANTVDEEVNQLTDLITWKFNLK